MSRQGRVYNDDRFAGIIKEEAGKYIFRYDDTYFLDPETTAISLSFPKRKQEYQSKHLFPFFYGLLAEGVTKNIQCQKLKIDEDDHFTRLLKTTGGDVIGSITVVEDK